MKNKKILNICLLTFGLITLITFILPIKKFEFVGQEHTFINVMFYLFNSIMVLMLVLLIVFSIINLFKDNYTFVKIMEMAALVGFLMNFVVLLIFACSSACRVCVGYLIVSIEMFICANFSQMARLFSSSKEMKENSKTVLPKGGMQKTQKNSKQKTDKNLEVVKNQSSTDKNDAEQVEVVLEEDDVKQTGSAETKNENGIN